MKKEKTVYLSFDELPLNLSADDVSGILGISRANAYILLHREDFPTIRIGKRIMIPRDRFLAWLNELPEVANG